LWLTFLRSCLNFRPPVQYRYRPDTKLRYNSILIQGARQILIQGSHKLCYVRRVIIRVISAKTFHCFYWFSRYRTDTKFWNSNKMTKRDLNLRKGQTCALYISTKTLFVRLKDKDRTRNLLTDRRTTRCIALYADICRAYINICYIYLHIHLNIL
jgi:hypothetical protein